MQVGLVLEKVQVPPGLLFAVVGRTARNAAFRTGETGCPGRSRGGRPAAWQRRRTCSPSPPTAARRPAPSETGQCHALQHPERRGRGQQHIRGALPPNPRDI